MNIDNIHIAYESERGVQATCPTTGETYITSRARVLSFDGRRVVACTCRHCDAYCYIRTDPQFNPSQPQIHIYYLSDTHYAEL